MTDMSPMVPDTPPRQGRLTRKRVADRLGVSVSTVRRLEGHVLHPVRGDDGVHYFDSEEVERFAPTRVPRRTLSEGQLAAELFRCFDQGCNLRQIVSELAVPPGKVRALYAEWCVPDLLAGERRRRAEKAEKGEQREWREHDRRMRELTEDLKKMSP